MARTRHLVALVETQYSKITALNDLVITYRTSSNRLINMADGGLFSDLKLLLVITFSLLFGDR